ncbi:MAG TPA: hypothetical protein VKQ71_00690, partial [Acidimicrobiales bacterium]|nr:hypothetical protein [Acidimicrobiales bacterium]
MSIPGTTVAQARKNLLADIQAQLPTNPLWDGAGPVQAQLDALLGTFVPYDYILIGIHDRVQIEVHAMVGSEQAGHFHEVYTIEVICSAFRGGDDPTSTFDDC